MHFAVLAESRVKLKESEKYDKRLNLARELKKQQQQNNKKTKKHEGNGDTNETGGLGNKRTS